MDTHTAVAQTVLMDYRVATGDDTQTLVVSTASPFKFCDSVLSALGENDQKPGTEILGQLTAKTGAKAPAPLATLAGKAVRFDQVCEKADMVKAVQEMLV